MYRLKTPQEIIGADAPNFTKDNTHYSDVMRRIASDRLSGTLLGNMPGGIIAVNFIIKHLVLPDEYVCVNAPKDWFSEIEKYYRIKSAKEITGLDLVYFKLGDDNYSQRFAAYKGKKGKKVSEANGKISLQFDGLPSVDNIPLNWVQEVSPPIEVKISDESSPLPNWRVSSDRLAKALSFPFYISARQSGKSAFDLETAFSDYSKLETRLAADLLKGLEMVSISVTAKRGQEKHLNGSI